MGDPPVGDPPVSAVSAAPVPVVPVGSAQSLEGGLVTVTVHGINRAVPATYGHPGLRTALDVEVCIDARDLDMPGVSAAPWSLTDGTGARYLPTQSMDPKLPAYASSTSTLVKVAPGECLRGWLMIEVPAGAKVTGVRYGLDDGTLLRWSI